MSPAFLPPPRIILATPGVLTPHAASAARYSGSVSCRLEKPGPPKKPSPTFVRSDWVTTSGRPSILPSASEAFIVSGSALSAALTALPSLVKPPPAILRLFSSSIMVSGLLEMTTPPRFMPFGLFSSLSNRSSYSCFVKYFLSTPVMSQPACLILSAEIKSVF